MDSFSRDMKPWTVNFFFWGVKKVFRYEAMNSQLLFLGAVKKVFRFVLTYLFRRQLDMTSHGPPWHHIWAKALSHKEHVGTRCLGQHIRDTFFLSCCKRLKSNNNSTCFSFCCICVQSVFLSSTQLSLAVALLKWCSLLLRKATQYE